MNTKRISATKDIMTPFLLNLGNLPLSDFFWYFLNESKSMDNKIKEVMRSPYVPINRIK